MSNRLLPMKQTDIKRLTKEQNILDCFRNALNDADERTKRNTVSEILRLAIVGVSVDGYRLLHDALSEKYSQPIPVENQSLSMIAPLPSTLMRSLAGQSESHNRAEFKCPNCGADFKSAKGLQGHGPSRCILKTGKKV